MGEGRGVPSEGKGRAWGAGTVVVSVGGAAEKSTRLMEGSTEFICSSHRRGRWGVVAGAGSVNMHDVRVDFFCHRRSRCRSFI